MDALLPIRIRWRIKLHGWLRCCPRSVVTLPLAVSFWFTYAPFFIRTPHTCVTRRANACLYLHTRRILLYVRPYSLTFAGTFTRAIHYTWWWEGIAFPVETVQVDIAVPGLPCPLRAQVQPPQDPSPTPVPIYITKRRMVKTHLT